MRGISSCATNAGRTAFINKIAAPIASKMFESGMIP